MSMSVLLACIYVHHVSVVWLCFLVRKGGGNRHENRVHTDVGTTETALQETDFDESVPLYTRQ